MIRRLKKTTNDDMFLAYGREYRIRSYWVVGIKLDIEEFWDIGQQTVLLLLSSGGGGYTHLYRLRRRLWYICDRPVGVSVFGYFVFL